jgi:hypothetical protein
MRPTKAILLLGALLGCASSQQTATTTAGPKASTTAAATTTAAPKPVVIDPVGAYEFSTIVDGNAVTGTLTITGTAGAYSGKIVTSTFPEIPITGARVEDKTVVAIGSMPDGELTIRMLMDGTNFTGKWELGGETGEFNGKKLTK